MIGLTGVFPDDYLTEAEMTDLRLARQKDTILTVNRQATVQDKVHETLSEVPGDLLLRAVKAHIDARPDLDPHELEAFGNSVNRVAWAMQRGD